MGSQNSSASSSSDGDDLAVIEKGVAMKTKRKRNTMGSQELTVSASPISPKGMRWSQKGDETVDDMVIDDYFQQNQNQNSAGDDDYKESAPQPMYNRVHSRIPAKQH